MTAAYPVAGRVHDVEGFCLFTGTVHRVTIVFVNAPVHPASMWATSTTLDRAVLATLSILVIGAAVLLSVYGLIPAACAVLGIAVLGVVAFACTAPDDEADVPAAAAVPEDV